MKHILEAASARLEIAEKDAQMESLENRKQNIQQQIKTIKQKSVLTQEDRSQINQLRMQQMDIEKQILQKHEQNVGLNKQAASVEQPSNVREAIFKYFMENPDPADVDIHIWAEQLGISPEDLESEIYRLLTDLIKEKAA